MSRSYYGGTGSIETARFATAEELSDDLEAAGSRGGATILFADTGTHSELFGQAVTADGRPRPFQLPSSDPFRRKGHLLPRAGEGLPV
jgi:hypothetical protein